MKRNLCSFSLKELIREVQGRKGVQSHWITSDLIDAVQRVLKSANWDRLVLDIPDYILKGE